MLHDKDQSITILDVFKLAQGNKWIKIPDPLIKALNLPHGIGICGGILCTNASAIGINRTLTRLNSIQNKGVN